MIQTKANLTDRDYVKYAASDIWSGYILSYRYTFAKVLHAQSRLENISINEQNRGNVGPMWQFWHFCFFWKTGR